MGMKFSAGGKSRMNIIDLFAGCGGLSTGFEMAGFHIPLAVEKDDWASETYKHNHKDYYIS